MDPVALIRDGCEREGRSFGVHEELGDSGEVVRYPVLRPQIGNGYIGYRPQSLTRADAESILQVN
jgi:hypothetical protein